MVLDQSIKISKDGIVEEASKAILTLRNTIDKFVKEKVGEELGAEAAERYIANQRSYSALIKIEKPFERVAKDYKNFVADERALGEGMLGELGGGLAGDITNQGNISKKGLVRTIFSKSARPLTKTVVGLGDVLGAPGVASALGAQTFGGRIRPTGPERALSELGNQIDMPDIDRMKEVFPSIAEDGTLSEPRDLQQARHFIDQIRDPSERAKALMRLNANKKVKSSILPKDLK